MSDPKQDKKTWTVVTPEHADVHTTTNAPDALRTYVRQLSLIRPESVHQVWASHRHRIEKARKKDNVLLIWAAWGFAVPSVAITVALIFLAWMVSGPIKAGVLAALVLIGWWLV